MLKTRAMTFLLLLWFLKLALLPGLLKLLNDNTVHQLAQSRNPWPFLLSSTPFHLKSLTKPYQFHFFNISPHHSPFSISVTSSISSIFTTSPRGYHSVLCDFYKLAQRPSLSFQLHPYVLCAVTRGTLSNANLITHLLQLILQPLRCLAHSRHLVNVFE